MFRKIKLLLIDFFHFNKQERNGVFVLCIIIVLLFIFRLFMPYLLGEDEVDLTISNSTFSEEVYEKTHVDNHKDEHLTDKLFTTKELFVFNPNTISMEDAIKLGFSKKLSTTLIKFRSKGGKFYKPEDLKKLYGLTPKLYNELESYILIPETVNSFKPDSVKSGISSFYEKKPKIQHLLELNTADSLSIVYLKGVGPGFTKRIIKYRTMLGGFHSISQLKEVYGMTDSLYKSLISQITLDAKVITFIPINAIDFNSLRKHPYFNFQTAQAIINYRLKHGKLTEAIIKSIGIFNEEKLNLILPYLNY